MGDAFGKILVVQQKMIGDVLTSTILLEALRKKYPNAELHYLVNAHTVPVVENNPFIDKLVLFTPEMEKSKLVFHRFLKQIREEKYDVVIDVYGKLSSNLITLFSRAKMRIGQYKKYTSFFYSHTVKNLKEAKTADNLAKENRLRLLGPLGIEVEKKSKPKIHITEREKSDAGAFLFAHNIDFGKPLVMVSLLGSSPSKTYPLPYMAKMLDFVVAKRNEVQLIFNYLPSQKEKASKVVDLCKEKTKSRIWADLYIEDLRKFLAVVSQCHVLIGNEGGAVNMAKALNVPTFAVFSPWIRQEAWGSGRGTNHIGAHLKNHRPDFFENVKSKKLKKKQKELYAEFGPELFQKKLLKFMNEHI